jgi:hypothetical protein
MERVAVGDRILPVAEGRRQLGAADRQPRRQAHQVEVLLGGRIETGCDLLLEARDLAVELAEVLGQARGGSSGPPLAGSLSVPAFFLSRPDGSSFCRMPIRLLSCAAWLSRRNSRPDSAPSCSSANGSAACGRCGAAATGWFAAAAGTTALRASSRVRRRRRAASVRQRAIGEQRCHRHGPHP